MMAWKDNLQKVIGVIGDAKRMAGQIPVASSA